MRCSRTKPQSPSRALRAAALIAASALGAAAFAAGAPDADTEGSELETIVVTAQLRSENVQDVSIAIAAFDGERLADAGARDAMQLQFVVPSLTYNATGDAAQPYLRGIGTRLASLGLEPSIATYVDDRYVPRPFGAVFDMLDIERVEVLKGPQGTLYGRNAAGGAIRAITRDPGEEPDVRIAAKVGNYDYAALDISAGGPLASSLRGQIAAALESRDGLATNLVPSGRREADDLGLQTYRGKLLWDLSDSISAKLGVSWWRHGDWNGRDLTAVGLPETNRAAALYGGVTSRQRDRFASAIPDDDSMREAAADLRFDVRFGAFDLASITTYTDGDYDQWIDLDLASTKLIDDESVEHSRTISQEFRLLSARPGPLAWIAGLFYYRQTGTNLFVFPDSVSLQPQYPPGTDLTNGLQTAVSEAHALFGQGTYTFGERWSVTVGGRWNHESKSATLEAVAGDVTNAPTPFKGEKSWDPFTPRLSIERHTAVGLAYFTYSRGFKSGGYNYPASLGPVLDPEVLDSYEAGLKSNLLGRRLRLDAALFSYDFRNLQVTRNTGGAFLTTENAADAKARGLELDAAFALSAELSLVGGLALIDSEYTDYVAGVLVPQTTPPYGSVPLAGGLDVRGRPLLRSPDRAAYVGLRYDRPLRGGGRLPLAVNYAYKSSYYFDFSAVPQTEWLRQPATGVLNARVAYAAPRGRWEVGFWGTNLTNEVYYDDAVLTAISSRVSYADPRFYGVDFRLRL